MVRVKNVQHRGLGKILFKDKANEWLTSIRACAGNRATWLDQSGKAVSEVCEAMMWFSHTINLYIFLPIKPNNLLIFCYRVTIDFWGPQERMSLNGAVWKDQQRRVYGPSWSSGKVMHLGFLRCCFGASCYGLPMRLCLPKLLFSSHPCQCKWGVIM